jgi:anti-anti-sigma regulatory factor
LRELRRAGGDIKLFGMDPDVYYVFTMLGFNIVLSSFDILSDAIEDFRTARSDAEPVRATAAAPSLMEPETPVLRAPEMAARVVASTPGMDIVWEKGRDGVRVARVSGVIETTAVSLLSDELQRELAAQPRGVVFDLTRVEYISSSGWGQFARAYEATRAVALFGMGPDLDEVYSCLEFHSFLPAFGTEEEAMRAVLERRTATPPPAPVAPVVDDDDAAEARIDELLSEKPELELPESIADPKPAAPRVEPANDPAATEPSAPLWGNPNRPIKSDGNGSSLDVSSAQADRHKGRDEKLRALGWEKYGEQLKNRAGSGKLKDSGPDHLDPEPGDGEEKP